ncbi:hypothetical protein GLW08_21250 [Pontibacillus yanchengensis]|uniref:Uncharacterized protein n=2 Tax=Pontibacillus yanchengensis TaxID=462910 RepID=A0ACC7VM48_9BACI|nr:hypothetical protein [Pontibacillus yanchengensis]MYL35411.1 hypothetical protein [Pontibacillus yanchengensis]MYL55830.1 hypothetical protein [Pontibacillus yanchengensis]
MEKSKVRKVRSDKKKDVKPFVSLPISECIHRISYITSRPVKDIAEELCVRGLYSKKAIELLSEQFKRDFNLNEYTIYIGDRTIENDRTNKIIGPKKRITIRFGQQFHSRLGELAFALDMTLASTTSLLLEYSIKDTELVNHLLRRFVASELDPKRMEQLKEVYRFIRKENPYEEEFTFSMFINFLFDELKCTTESFAKQVGEWLDLKSSR